LQVARAAPSGWLRGLNPGGRVEVVPDETVRPLRVEVKRLGARIDEGSQTLLLIGSLPENASGLLAGMSGSARFPESP